MIPYSGLAMVDRPCLDSSSFGVASVSLPSSSWTSAHAFVSFVAQSRFHLALPALDQYRHASLMEQETYSL